MKNHLPVPSRELGPRQKGNRAAARPLRLLSLQQTVPPVGTEGHETRRVPSPSDANPEGGFKRLHRLSL